MSFASAPFLVLFAAMLAAQLFIRPSRARQWICLLYTSDAADE